MQRYMVDYAWILIIAAICIFIQLYNMHKTDEARRIMKKAFAVITMYIMIINFCGGIVSEKSFMRNNSPEEYYKLKYSVDFWE